MADGDLRAEGNVSLTDAAAYADPTEQCDLVMKGGITSGIVYPLGVCRLATRYRLRQIGGTSAGAIAAAGAAAAEHGREAGGFVKLAAVPAWLGSSAPEGSGTNLRSLFQPSPLTRKTFSVVMALIERGSRAEKAGRLIGRITAAHPVAAVAGALPGLLFVLAGLTGGGGGAVPAVLAGLLLAVIGAAGGLVAAAVLHAGQVLPEAGFGICPGFPGFTEWLANVFDDLAAMHQHRRPLTFGDLAAKGVELRMLTTNLTYGIPFRLPLEEHTFLYDSNQFRQLFPSYVVDHMDAHAELPSEPVPAPPGVNLRHLPDAEHLPVVVAVRMSLSFPLLYSAVPLWAVDYAGSQRAEQVWFSDGGITSNFPIHFFDALLPTRPTFAINLGPGERLDPTDERKNIVVPRRAASGILPRWTHIEGVMGFVRAVLDTMQNWSDNNQSRMPGYRDRIIRVLHRPEEGGLNLDMGPETIRRLSERGEAAGVQFLQFDLAQHRWTRYRSSMSVLEKTLRSFGVNYLTPVPGVPTYEEMIDHPPQSYSRDWTRRKAEFAHERTEDLVEVAEAWPDRKQSFAAGAPKPSPILRVTPDV